MHVRMLAECWLGLALLTSTEYRRLLNGSALYYSVDNTKLIDQRRTE